ncbi:uncharacterized protein tmem273 [Pygocentrus nattereri]|uniref:uncharacterized protein tmem273 n=1 Tax=Pygocentrus nattereri TaxID=42514 RepID=UPI000814B439|nr:uncharacterized protein tmem273 [Pygocentrus nattereri]XP_037400292.1 uncharacterized protein tmem273 [Pygocentrus nattereri]
MFLTPEKQRHRFTLIFLFTVGHNTHLFHVDAGQLHEYTLLRCVRGDGGSSGDEPASEVKYAVIGTGIGLFLAACFIAIKLCMIRRHMLDNEPSEDSMRRPSTMQCTELESRR